MIHEAEALVDQLKRLVASAQQVGEDTGMHEKWAQLQVLGKTVTELECQGLPVPVDIERIVAGLRADLDGAQDAEDTLCYLSRTLDDVARSIGESTAAERGRRDPSVGDALATTSGRRVLRGLIVEVLDERGGRATSKDVIAGVEKRLQGRFLPGDLRVAAVQSACWSYGRRGHASARESGWFLFHPLHSVRVALTYAQPVKTPARVCCLSSALSAPEDLPASASERPGKSRACSAYPTSLTVW